MTIYEFNDYKKFVIFRIERSPRGGRGLYRRIAELLGIHTSYVSQIFSGDRDISPEQAWQLCGFFSLNDLESEFFLALVRLNTASHFEYKSKCLKDLENIRARSLEIKNRVKADITLTTEEKIIFYSHWYYSGVRLLTANPKFRTPETIANELNLNPTQVSKILEFLVQCQLCTEVAGEFTIKKSKTHLGSDSPLLPRHHVNWRVKAFEKIGAPDEDELYFTSPLTITKADATKLKSMIVDFIEEAMKIVDASTGDKDLRCLNLDWFKISKKI